MRHLMLVLLALVLTACAAIPLAPVVPTAAAAPAAPCTGQAHHAFDFWIGEWNVFAQNGQKAGENSISRAEYGCLILEHWTGSNSITGQSYNFLDPATGKWRQVWVSGGAVIDHTGGLTERGSMRLEGTIAYQAGGPALPFRGEWTPNADGSVTQHFEQGDPETGTWSDWFVGTYVRKVAE